MMNEKTKLEELEYRLDNCRPLGNSIYAKEYDKVFELYFKEYWKQKTQEKLDRVFVAMGILAIPGFVLFVLFMIEVLKNGF